MSALRPRALLAVAPNHLGDGVMALPAMHALARLAPLRIQGPRWAPELYRDVPQHGSGLPDTAVVFGPSLRAAWSVRGVARRIGTPTDHRGWLLTDSVAPGVHTADTFRRLAERAGAEVTGVPTYAGRADDPDLDVPMGHAGLNPVSVSGAVREWGRWRELADELGQVVFYGGPGEDERIAPLAGSHRRVVGSSLPAFANALRRCSVFVSNDSGAAHFAAACGTRVVVVHGSTTPWSTGVPGALAVRGPPLPCAPCYGRVCTQGHACLDIPLRAVRDAVEERLRG